MRMAARNRKLHRASCLLCHPGCPCAADHTWLQAGLSALCMAELMVLHRHQAQHEVLQQEPLPPPHQEAGHDQQQQPQAPQQQGTGRFGRGQKVMYAKGGAEEPTHGLVVKQEAGAYQVRLCAGQLAQQSPGLLSACLTSHPPRHLCMLNVPPLSV